MDKTKCIKEHRMKQEAKKTAIITGSGRGIGKETVITLARSSLNVVVCSRTQSEINSTVEEINKQTGNSNVLGIKCDVIFNNNSTKDLDYT